MFCPDRARKEYLVNGGCRIYLHESSFKSVDISNDAEL
jgi:hypothetical protein